MMIAAFVIKRAIKNIYEALNQHDLPKVMSKEMQKQ
jgi:hypothetical protein